MKYLVVIPARYKSERLPGKPIINIGGLPMIVRTYNQCRKVVSKDQIVVATDSLKIKQVCDNYNIAFCGDWFDIEGFGRIEGAILSALKLSYKISSLD